MLNSSPTMRLLRRGWMRCTLITVAILCLLFYVYFMNSGSSSNINGLQSSKSESVVHIAAKTATLPNEFRDPGTDADSREAASGIVEDQVTAPCTLLSEADVDIKTNDVFGTLNFNPRYKEFWDDNFERRFLKRRAKWNKLPLKVIVVPHSHNDPGWLKTFEGYFDTQTANILNSMVEKLTRLPNMTFIWSEMSFFSKWWERAHPQKRSAVKTLLQSGRLEIVTGGWVMMDEATAHLYAMLDQLIEGHQWSRSNLDYIPRSSWSVDPFGHGATVPYLLRESGLKQMVIQRIHFAWKKYLAEQQGCDFIWRQSWDSSGDTDVLCHNFPFDLYSIKHSCGPHPLVCLTFDFRKIRGEFTEYSQRSQPINSWNLKERVETLLAEYGRTASFFPHNVALIPLGDDFRYDKEIEWDQQYSNYKMLFDYINSHPDYHAEIRFGTVSDYFDAVNERMGDREKESGFLKLSGDFFPYGEIFVEGRPAYWTGYYTTRPFWKSLSRELESHLRAAEILYSFALVRARQSGLNRTRQILEQDYEVLRDSHNKLGIFQHHDAITGTSKTLVMHDFGLKLLDALQGAIKVLTHATQYLLTKHPLETELDNEMRLKKWPTFLSIPYERNGLYAPLTKLPVFVPTTEIVKVVVYNPLGQATQEPVYLIVTNINVCVTNSENKHVPYQLNPVWNTTSRPYQLVNNQYKLLFIADLPPLAIVTYYIRHIDVRDSSTVASVTVFNGGIGRADQNSVFSIQKDHSPSSGTIGLENPQIRAIFSRSTGLLESVINRSSGHSHHVQLQFQSYMSAQFHSGAYLFMPDPRHPVRNLSDNAPFFRVLRGIVASEVTIFYPEFLQHSVRIYHTSGILGKALYMESVIDFPSPPKLRENELFMRILTDVNNGNVFFTDSNGFQTVRRTTLPKLGIEGNYYPATSHMYIQDEVVRISLLLSHAHGVSSKQSGWLETMLDRRMVYDDSRGMGEGVIDNKRTISRFWLLVEDRLTRKESHSQPSLLANRLSNSLTFPPHVFVVDSHNSPSLLNRISLLSRTLPCDINLVMLRTLPVKAYFEFPSHSSLMVLHRQSYSCDYSDHELDCPLTDGQLVRGTRFKELHLSSVTRISLTGLREIEVIDSLADISIPIMRLYSYNVTFT